jgi:hypothetical protein
MKDRKHWLKGVRRFKKMKQSGVLDTKSYNKGVEHFKQKARGDKKEWLKQRRDMIRKHPADGHAYASFIKQNMNDSEKSKLKRKLKIQRQKIAMALKGGKKSDLQKLSELRTEKQNLKNQLRKERSLKQLQNIKRMNNFLKNNKLNPEEQAKARKKFRTFLYGNKKKKIARCKRQILRNRAKVKWCRKNRQNYKNPGFVQRYNKAVKKIQLDQDKLRRLRE